MSLLTITVTALESKTLEALSQIIAAGLLTLVVSFSTPAGEMNLPVAPPPPPVNVTTISEENPGQLGPEEPGIDSTTELIIIVLETLLPIF